MEQTPGHLSRLPYAAKEIDALQDLCASMSLKPVKPRHLKNDVVPRISDCEIFHFAGHGYTNTKDPSNSYLLLGEYERDHVAVADLLAMNLREKPPFLAYLSACGTGQIKDEKFFDESIHLINAFQIAGFRHVIGTLWEVSDEFCVEMAKIIYQEIADRGMTDESVSRGLHKGTLELRNRWLNAGSKITLKPAARTTEPSLLGEERGAYGDVEAQDRKARDVDEISEDEENESLKWVPYVHFGI